MSYGYCRYDHFYSNIMLDVWKVNTLYDPVQLLVYHNVFFCILVKGFITTALVCCFGCSIKLLKVKDLCKAVHKDVNRLLSKNQLDFVCKVLSNSGTVCNPC